MISGRNGSKTGRLQPRSDELDEFGLDLDGSGYEIGQLYYQMLLSLALDREKMPLEIVEDAADDAHGLAVH